MVYEFLETASYQYIDDCGKLRGLVYEASGKLSSITLITPPLHPLAMRSVRDLDYERVAIKRAKIFAREYGFNMVELNTSDESEEGMLFGIWYEYTPNTSLGRFYIPILEVALPAIFSQPLKIVERMKQLPRKFTEEPSKFDLHDSKISNLRLSKIVANFLKQAVLYYHVNVTPPTKSSFKVSKNFFESIHLRLSHPEEGMVMNLAGEDRELFFAEDNKIKVPSKSLISNLLNYLEITKSNTPYLDTFRNRETFTNEYEVTSDFRLDPTFCVFSSKQDIVSYLNDISTDISTIYTIPNPFTSDPYLLANYNVSGEKVVMIQNTSDGTLESAYILARCWYHNNLNGGFVIANVIENYPTSTEPLPEGEVRVVRSVNVPSKRTGTKGVTIEALSYDNGVYAAILPID